MSFELHQDKHQLPAPYAATAFQPRTPVTIAGTSVPLAIPVASANVRPDGVTGAATYSANESVVVYFGQNIVKMRCSGSTGFGADLIVGSTNGAVQPGGVAASAHWIIGQSMSAAAAGEVVSVFVNPRKA